MPATTTQTMDLNERLPRILDNKNPDAAIIIPVNARGDLRKVLDLLEDISHYSGANHFQILLVVNNYDPDQPPTTELDSFHEMGVQTLPVPVLGGHSGVPPALRARMLALPYANTRACLFFDADCRIPNASGCLDWYCEAFRHPEVMLAYTKVGHYNWPSRLGIRAWLLVHYSWRWLKRNILRTPTPRGSSYALDKNLKQQLYDEGYLADETGIGRLIKAFDKTSLYSGKREHQVLTDGRMFEGASPFRLFTKYAFRRIRINLQSMFIRQDAAQRTGREGEKGHEYDANGRLTKTTPPANPSEEKQLVAR